MKHLNLSQVKALTCMFMLCAIAKFSHSQTITEDLIANPNNLITYGGPSPIIFPCGSNPDGSYHFEVTLDFPIGTQLTITEPSDGNSTLFDLDDAILTDVSVDNSGVYTMESETATVLIPITFCNYSGAGFSPLEYEVLTSILGDLSITTDPFEVGIPTLSVETEYSNSDGIISTSVDADLYFRNLDHEFTRTTTFSPYSELGGTVKINSLIMEYSPEQEIDLVSLTISTPSSSSSFTGTIPSFFDFLELGLLDESIIQSEEFTITEVFSINHCSAEVFGEGSIGATTMNFKLCDCFDGFNFNHVMNVTVEDEGTPIEYCFDIHPNLDFGIDACSSESFDVEFSFYNPGESTNDPNGIKELGWVVLPIDLEAFGITSLEELFAGGKVEIVSFASSDGNSPCNWSEINASFDLSELDPESVKYYADNLGFSAECDAPNLPDDFRRVAFNFSLMNAELGQTLTDWYNEGVYNSFNSNSKFGIVFKDLSIDYDEITVLNGVGVSEGENPFLFAEDLAWNCGPTGFTFFQANNSSEVNNSYYTVYRSMCEKLVHNRDATLPMRPQIMLEDTEFIEGTALSGCDPQFEYAIENPFAHAASSDEYINYNNENGFSAYAEAPEGDFELEIAGSSLAIDFEYGAILNDVEDLNLWDFNVPNQIDLFSCPSSSLRGRVYMPLYLNFYDIVLDLVNEDGSLVPLTYTSFDELNSCSHVIEFDAPEVDCSEFPCNASKKIRVSIFWPAELTTCPEAIDGCPLFTYNSGDMDFRLIEVCDCGTENSLSQELACASHIVTFRCGDCGVTIGGAENTEGEPAAEFNMVENPDEDEYFRVKRNTFGYPTDAVLFDPDGPVGEQTYDGVTGFPLDALDEDGVLPQTGILPFANSGEAESNGCNLYRVYPGDELQIEAYGIYQNLAPENGNIEMAFAIQTFTPEDHFIIPDVPSGSITFTNQEDGSIEVFPIETITMGQCPTMDEMNNDAGTPATTVTFSLGDDFYNAAIGLDGEYDMAFSSSIQMYTEFFPQNTVEPHELIVWTGNFVTTGIGNLPLDQAPVASDYCWIEQTCDFYSAAITCFNIRSWIDFELLVPESMFQSCSRPYVFEFYSSGGINFEHFPNEYRPTIGLRSVEMSEVEGLDFTHGYNGGPWGFTTQSINGNGSELEFIVTASDDLMTVDFSALPIPDHQTNQHQYRLFGGHAVDVVGCQQIGMEGDIQFGNFPLTMNENAIDAKFEYVNFLSIEDPLLNEVEHIDDPNNELVGDDLQIHRVGFYATDDGPQAIASASGSISGQEIHYINPNTHIGGIYGGSTTTTGFFVIPEIISEIEITGIRLIKIVDGIQIGDPVTGVEHSSDPGTFFFHKDHSGNCTNDFLNCLWDEHLFRIHPDNQWFLEFDYELNEPCPVDDLGNPTNTLMFNYFFGSACGTSIEEGDFDMTRCQTCLSYFGNCEDCSCQQSAGIVDSHSIFTEYSGEMDAYVDQVHLYLPNALLNADINDVSSTCAPEYTIDLAVPMPDGALYMDADGLILTVEYPENWINLPIVTLEQCSECVAQVNPNGPGLAEVTFTQDGNPLVISSGESITLVVSFPGPTASIDGDLVEFNVNAQTICGSNMPVSNGSSVFSVEPSSNNDLTVTFNTTDESCTGSIGASDGELTVNISGGSGNYEVLWVTCPDGQLNCQGESAWTITDLGAGDYTVVVTDTETGCSSQFTTTINLGPCCELSFETNLIAPNPCLGETATVLDVITQNQIGNAVISILPDGSINQLDNSVFQLNQCGIDYTIQVSDESGCASISQVVSIDCLDYTPPTFAIEVSELDCRPEDGSYVPSNGEISVTVTGGSNCMTYSWECPENMANCPSPSEDPNLSNAVAGWYTLTWEDCTFGCTGTETIQVTTVPCCAVDFSPVVVNVNGCTPCSGSIVLDPSVPQLMYQYQWTGPGDFTSTNQDLYNLCPGEYNLMVAYGNCVEELSFTITEGEQPSMIIEESLPSVCSEINFAYIEPIISDFVDNYSITISGGLYSPYNEGYRLYECGIEYTVTLSVEDQPECSISETYLFECSDYETPTFDFVITDPDCIPSESDIVPDGGSIEVIVINGSEDMNYSWICPEGAPECPSNTDIPNISNAIPGTYILEWIDEINGCSGSISTILTSQNCCDLEFDIYETSIQGCLDCSGSIEVVPSISDVQVDYQWQGSEFSSSDQNISNLCSGEYELLISYGSGNCVQNLVGIINEPSEELALVLEVTSPDICNGMYNSTVTPIITGATGGYEVGIAPTEDSGLFIVEDGVYTLSCGFDYIFEVIDGTGCYATANFYSTCSEYETPSFFPTITSADCFPSDDSYIPSGGSIIFDYTGPETGMSYSWECPPEATSCPQNQSTPDLFDATPGTYTLNWTWTDGTETCSGTEQYEILAPPCCDLEFDQITTLQSPECSECEGAIELTPTVIDYEVDYNWSNGAESNYISELCAGDYSVTVSYSEGCSEEFEWTVDEIASSPLIIQPNSVGSCVGEMISATISNLTNCNLSQIEWTVSNSAGTDLTGTGSTINFTIENTGEYTICASQICEGTVCGNEVCYEPIFIENCTGFSDCMSIEDDISSPNYWSGARGAIETPSGYVIAGTIHHSVSNSNQYLVEKDHNNEIVFQSMFGEKVTASSPIEQAEDLVMHSNYIYTVGSSRYSDTGYDVVVSRYNYSTKVLEDARAYTFSQSSNDYGKAIDIIESDGQTYLLIGGSTDVQDPDGDMLAMLVNPNNLELESYRMYDNNSRRDECRDVLVLSTGDAVLVGQSATKATAIKIQPNLGLIDEQQFTFNQGRTWINSIIESNNRLYMVGAMNSFPDNDVLLVRTNLNLDISGNEYTTWSSSDNDSSTDEEALEISRHPSGRLFLVGKLTRGSTQDGFLAYMGADLTVQWVKQVDEPTNTILHSLTFPTDDDGSYVLAVGEIDRNSFDQDLFVIKWRSIEDICCLTNYSMRSRRFNITAPAQLNEVSGSYHNRFDLRISETEYPCVSVCNEGAITLRSASDKTAISKDKHLSIFPNPNSGAFSLIMSAENNVIVEVAVLDSKNQLVLSQQFTEADEIREKQYNLETISSGVYMIRVKLSNGELYSSRIVITK